MMSRNKGIKHVFFNALTSLGLKGGVENGGQRPQFLTPPEGLSEW